MVFLKIRMLDLIIKNKVTKQNNQKKNSQRKTLIFKDFSNPSHSMILRFPQVNDIRLSFAIGSSAIEQMQIY